MSANNNTAILGRFWAPNPPDAEILEINEIDDCISMQCDQSVLQLSPIELVSAELADCDLQITDHGQSVVTALVEENEGTPVVSIDNAIVPYEATSSASSSEDEQDINGINSPQLSQLEVVEEKVINKHGKIRKSTLRLWSSTSYDTSSQEWHTAHGYSKLGKCDLTKPSFLRSGTVRPQPQRTRKVSKKLMDKGSSSYAEDSDTSRSSLKLSDLDLDEVCDSATCPAMQATSPSRDKDTSVVAASDICVDYTEDNIDTLDSSDPIHDKDQIDPEELKVLNHYKQTTFWVKRIYGMPFDSYLDATADIVGDKNISYFNAENRTRIEITVVDSNALDKIIKTGLIIDGSWYKSYRLSEKPIELTLCGAPPFVSHSVLAKALSKFGKCEPSDFANVMPSDKKSRKHILPHRRRVLLRVSEKVEIPDELSIKFGGDEYTVRLVGRSVKCFLCGRLGHMRRQCRSGLPNASIKTAGGKPMFQDIPVMKTNDNTNVPPKRASWAQIVAGDSKAISPPSNSITTAKNLDNEVKKNTKFKLPPRPGHPSEPTPEFSKWANPPESDTKVSSQDKMVFVSQKNSEKVFELISVYTDAEAAMDRIGAYPTSLLDAIDISDALKVIHEEQSFFVEEGALQGLLSFIQVAANSQNMEYAPILVSTKRPIESADDMSGPAAALSVAKSTGLRKKTLQRAVILSAMALQFKYISSLCFFPFS